MSPSIHRESHRRFEIYAALPALEKAVIRLTAVSYVSISSRALQVALTDLDQPKGRAKAAIDSLARQELILRDQTAWGEAHWDCDPRISEMVCRELAATDELERFVQLARKAAPATSALTRGPEILKRFGNEDSFIRELRIAFYAKRESDIQEFCDAVLASRQVFWDNTPTIAEDPWALLAYCASRPFDADWLSSLPKSMRERLLVRIARQGTMTWTPDPAAIALFLEQSPPGKASVEARGVLAQLAILRGDLDTTAALASADPQDPIGRAALGAIALLRGQDEEAIRLFRDGLDSLRSAKRKKKVYFPSFLGMLYPLALHQRNAPGDMDEAMAICQASRGDERLDDCYRLLSLVPQLERSQSNDLQALHHLLTTPARPFDFVPWTTLIGAVILRRFDTAQNFAPYLPRLKAMHQQLDAEHFAWPRAELGALIGFADPEQASLGEQAAAFAERSGIRLLAGGLRREEAWERALNAIYNIVAPRAEEPAPGRPASPKTRLAWMITRRHFNPIGYALEAREQTLNARGSWNKGKPLSLKRIAETAVTCDYFTDQDRRIATCLKPDHYSTTYILEDRGWVALIGHPDVYWLDSGVNVEIVGGQPELRVHRKPGQSTIEIEFWPKLQPDRQICLVEDGMMRLKVLQLTAEHQRLATIIARGLEVPASAEQRVLASLSGAAALMTIQSDLDGAISSVETVDADPRIRVQLIPEGAGLRVALLVRPLGEHGAYHPPGEGGTTLIADAGGRRIQAQRDLAAERDAAQALMDRCPVLSDALVVDRHQHLIETLEESLQLMLELRDCGDMIAIEWPQGEKFRVAGHAGMAGFSLKVEKKRDWFAVSGGVVLDDGRVVELQRLLELTAQNRRGRFVVLDDGSFLALTENLRKRLEDVRAYTEAHGKEQRLHALAAPAFEDLTLDVGDFEADVAWHEQLERLATAEAIEPTLPTGLLAELRDYQRAGFEWLSRLAAWGVGACLADDMGLGKTLQALALVLSRAGSGPSLVVAPTSVCFNWIAEAERFAPSLNIRTLSGAGRGQTVENLQPFDLAVCSYGLLQQEAVGELLAGVEWATIVLDEAQAIKNFATKRSRQAMSLKARFKMITTGTPLENHLGELWNLFRFINPGLLGSLESFNRRFAIPIERDRDAGARECLKQLIRPFILRRTKAQVLSELPPRTEIEMQVELSEPETAFYEALRRQLLDELQHVSGVQDDQRFRVLAAITKLRRACCNPTLIAPDLGLQSSKLDLFTEILTEILDNQHKALVFSQFVDHLTLIREHLDARRVRYQYLDGATSVPERRRRVEAFQSGEGDVFLISLKAGGVGLNLTAADYVIHMDPWWNPAVEDQASDRAHRMGQQRPVTVYRLVTKNTIEEKIVSLHREKRDLADSLLEGGEMSSKLSSVELLALMQRSDPA